MDAEFKLQSNVILSVHLFIQLLSVEAFQELKLRIRIVINGSS